MSASTAKEKAFGWVGSCTRFSGSLPRLRMRAARHKRAETWRLHVSALKAALEREGWDGEWYRRAYFDDGTPLGSAANAECRIDSIAQSWGVISGAAEPGRAARAMAAVEQILGAPAGWTGSAPDAAF